MSTAQLNSNANSALIQTITASDSLKNPNVYSTQEINPPYAVQYTRVNASSGSIKSGASSTYQLPKFGIAQAVYLSYDVTCTADPAQASNTAAKGWDTFIGKCFLNVGDFIFRINSIDLMGSSRCISTLTVPDILASFSMLSAGEYHSVSKGCVSNRGAGAPDALTNPPLSTHKVTIPLMFPVFEREETQLDLSFLESFSIRVNWKGVDRPFTTSLSTTSVENATVLVRYKEYSEQSNAELISENFDRPELNQLSYRYHDEPTIDHTQVGGPLSVQKVSVEIKNTECITNLYCVIRQVGFGETTDGVNEMPVNIKSMKLLISGQEILYLNDSELNYTRLGGLTSACASMQTGVDDNVVGNVNAIPCISFALFKQKAIENGLSLRELNGVTIEVEFYSTPLSSDGTTYTVEVVEKALAIYSTSSATGRYSLAMAN